VSGTIFNPAKYLVRFRLFGLASACLTMFPFAGAEGAADRAELVTHTDPTAISSSGSSDSSAPLISGDGRFVVFLSSAQNLTTNAFLGSVNVFVRDRQLGTTTLASVSTNGASANGPCSSPGVSSNGQFVVFQSRASNLLPGSTNGVENIFVRDLLAGRTFLASANTNNVGGDRSSLNPQMTPAGRFVVFEGLAGDLVANDTNGLSDIFVRDLANSNTVLVSANTDGTGTGSGYSINPSIAPDGRFVVFESTTRSLVNDLNATSDIYLRDLTTDTTSLISVNTADNAAGSSQNAVISDDGRYVAFQSAANNLVAGDTDGVNDIFLRDLQTGTNILVSPAANFNVSTNAPTRPVISRTGQLVAFQTGSPPTGLFGTLTIGQIHVWDVQAGSNMLVSVSLDGTTPAAGVSHSPIISADSRFITFLSNATNLVANAANRQFQIYQRDLVAGVTTLVSVNPDGNGNNLDCSSPSASDDGRLVAFDSIDGGLVPGDLNDAYDVFVRDLATSSPELVSQAVTNLQSATPRGLSSVVPGCVTGDGRYVVFTTLANRLTANDTNRSYDVFVRDLWNGTNAPVSVSTNGTPANGNSRNPVVSADGRFVAFLSNSTDLAPDVTNTVNQIYLRDLQQGATTLVTVNANGVGSAGYASNPAISADGRFVVYESTARDLTADDANNFQDLFVFDRTTGSNTLVSVNASGTASGNGASRSPTVAPNGRTAIFLSEAKNLVTNTVPPGTQVFVRDLVDQTTVWVSQTGFGPSSLGLGQVASADGRFITYARSNLFIYDSILRTNLVVPTRAGNPSISANGRFVAFEKPVLSGNSAVSQDIVLFDTQLGTEMLASVNMTGTGGGNDRSRSPVIGADGRFVVFKSQSSDLVPNDNNGVSDVFVRDLVLAQTLLISLNHAGSTSGNLLSANPVMGVDGRTVLFETFASDLVADDFNQGKDIFVLRLGVGDSDQDGMDDGWEVTYFNNLSRDGLGDFDQDGANDVAEFKAGTNPANDASILRALSVASLSAGTATVFWSAVPGRTYQIEYKNDLNDAAWTHLPGSVIASDTTASKLDDTAGSAYRFYRVMLLGP
jgi:WD40 repeat protein